MRERLLFRPTGSPRPSALPQNACWVTFLLQANGCSPKTIKAYETALKSLGDFCKQTGLPEDPTKLTPDHIRAWIAHLRQSGLSAYSIHTYARTLKAFYGHAVRERKIKPSQNPFRVVQVPPPPKTMPSLYTPEAIKSLLDACPIHTSWGARDRAIILTLLYTGLRLSEVAGITLPNLDTKARILRVMGKGNKERTVGVHEEALRAILRWLAFRPQVNHEYLWVSLGKNRGEPLTAGGIQQIVRRLQRRTGIRVPRAVHAFRHTFSVAALWEARIPRRMLQEILGHSTDHATRVYEEGIAHLNAAEAQKELPIFTRLNRIPGSR